MLVRAATLGCLVGALGAGAAVWVSPRGAEISSELRMRAALLELQEPRERLPEHAVVEVVPQPSEGPRLAALDDVVADEPEALSDVTARSIEVAEELPEDAPVSPPPVVESTDPEQLSTTLLLGALAQETAVYQKPDRRTRKLGLLRTGALVNRAALPASRRGCKGGWYRVAPEGYVCVGRAATLDVEHPVLQLASVRPDRGAPLPYAYGRARRPVRPLLYTRLPNPAEQARVEPDLSGLRGYALDAVWKDEAEVSGPHSLLVGGAPIPQPYGLSAPGAELTRGFAVMNSAFAFVDLFEAEGRKWGLTTELSLVPLDRVSKIEASAFHGVPLSEAQPLPLAFVRSSGAVLYAGDPTTGALRGARNVALREAFSLSGKTARFNGDAYLETVDGHYLRDKSLVRVEPPKQLPTFAKPGQTWIDVSILKQTLVAYEGDRPVYATLVSTGKDGLGDPKTTHSTVQGTFRIHTKHVTATMSGDDADDEFDLRDVPYVQYFHEGFALHAAYWHEGFGGPRSHGCVNLSPKDARWLFSWTEPPVPQAWHSALSHAGTIVHVHP